MSELCAFHHEHNFRKFSKIVQSSNKNFSLFAAIMPISQKVFKKSPSRCISSCQQDIKLDQFPSKIPTIEQLFCRTARWVLLNLLVPRIKNHLSSFELGFLNIFGAKTCCVVCNSYCFCCSATNMARKNVQKTFSIRLLR